MRTDTELSPAVDFSRRAWDHEGLEYPEKHASSRSSYIRCATGLVSRSQTLDESPATRDYHWAGTILVLLPKGKGGGGSSRTCFLVT